MFLTGTLLIGAGGVVSAMAPSFGVLLAGRAISGVGSALVAITAIVRLIALSDPARRGRTLGTYQAMLQGGTSLSPAVAGFASAAFGWPAAFWIAGVAALAGSVWVWAAGALRDGQPAGGRSLEVSGEQPAARPGVRGRRRLPIGFYLFSANYVTFVNFAMLSGLVQNVVPLFGGVRIGLNDAALGLVVGIATGFRFVISFIGSTLSDRYGRNVILFLGMGLLAVASFVFPWIGGTVSYSVASMALAVGVVGNAVPLAMLSDHVPSERMGRWVSINRFATDLGILVGPLALGLIIDAAGFDLAFQLSAYLAATVVVLAAVDLWRSGWRPARSSRPSFETGEEL